MTTKKNKNSAIVIVKPGANAPSNLLANAEIHFGGGLLAGIRLTGISLWLAHRKDETTFVSVTFPSREVMKADRSDYFSHVRGNKESLRRLQDAIREAYGAWHSEPAGDVADDTPSEPSAPRPARGSRRSRSTGSEAPEGAAL